MNALKAFNLKQWIDQHREFLQPPVCNRRVFRESEFIIMVVGGPNVRSQTALTGWEGRSARSRGRS